jgi:peptidoglycan glycosyltransferase
LYTPGSTFKTVTVAAAIDAGVADPGKVYDDAGIFEVDGRVIEERNRPDESKVRWTLEESYAYSLNIVFAQVGLNDLGPDVLWEYASRFGFGDEIPFDLPTAETQLVGSRVDLGNRALLADTAFGQGEILASPLQMAMVVAAVVNDGVMMRPWVGEVALDEQGNVIERFEHGEWRRVISGDSAATVRALMLASVAYGYASAAAIPGATVGGKTGTAEVGEGEPHAWFTGFAEANGRRLVVAIVVEHGGAGSQTALPIGRTLLASALGLEP